MEAQRDPRGDFVEQPKPMGKAFFALDDILTLEEYGEEDQLETRGAEF